MHMLYTVFHNGVCMWFFSQSLLLGILKCTNAFYSISVGLQWIISWCSVYYFVLGIWINMFYKEPHKKTGHDGWLRCNPIYTYLHAKHVLPHWLTILSLPMTVSKCSVVVALGEWKRKNTQHLWWLGVLVSQLSAILIPLIGWTLMSW